MVINDHSHPPYVYVSIDKTGSTTVNSLLVDHFGGTRTRNGLKVIPGNRGPRTKHFLFTVCRNPYERMVSWWWAVCRTGHDRYGHRARLAANGLSESLPDFLRLWQTKGGLAQVRWLEKNPPMDRIIRLENLDDEFNSLPFVGTPVVVPHRNAKPRPPWREIIDCESKAMIEDLYEEDFRYFGYEIE